MRSEASVTASRLGGDVQDRRLLYSVGVAAELLSMHSQTLRIYDKEGLLLPARKRKWRFYSPHDLARIRVMRYLVHKDGMSLKGLRRLLGLIPCWDIIDCPPLQRKECPQSAVRSRPCWSVAGRGQGKCRSCRVYSEALEYICDPGEIAAFFGDLAGRENGSPQK